MKKAIYILITLAVLGGVLAVAFWPEPSTSPQPESETLNLYGIDPFTLDPAVSSDATSHEYIVQIFSGLIGLDKDLEVAPDIAESWQVSPDGLTYTFYLRRDVTFHSGKKLTARDFKASWERACSPDTGSQTAPLYLGDIKGAQDMLSGRSSSLEGVRVIGDYELEVTIVRPESYFLYKLAYPTAFAVDIDTAKNDGWWQTTPNGTGPFKLKTWQQGSRLELEKYAGYYGQEASLDNLVYKLWAGTIMDLYETGDIDVAGVGAAYIDKVTDKKNEFWDEFIQSPSLNLMYIGFDFTREPFNDPLVRQAFASAVDKKTLVDLVFRGTAIAAEGVLPPGMPGFNKDLEGPSFNPQLANQLIKDSSYGSVENLPPITITTSGYGGFISAELESVVYQWKQNLGVDVTVRQLDPEDFYYNLNEEKDQMFYYGWNADYPHPQNFLEILFSSGSVNNTGQYDNPDFEQLLEEAATQTNEQESFRLYQQAEQLLMDDTALIPLYVGKNMMLVKPYVKGYELNPIGVVELNKVWIDNN